MRAVRVLYIFIVFGILIWHMPCYAQEQKIAESFGLYSKGLQYYRQGNLDYAKSILERAVSLDPRNDEAQGYLDLVNAEIRMRDKKQRLSEETDKYDFQPRETEATLLYDKAEPKYYAEADDKSYKYEQESSYAKNDSPGNISGEVRMAVGVTSEDVIWKDANGDNVGVPFEKNWRYLFGEDGYNTYDAKIYDRFKLDVNTGKETGLNVYGQIVIDPWTFVGTKDVRIMAIGADTADIKLKYWSNTRSTVNEIYRSNKGNIINLQEIEIADGKTIDNNTPTGLTDWYTAYTWIPAGTEIDMDYKPLRKLWIDYVSEDESFNTRLFLMADQAEALTSDDPLRLSNNHVYWEESPWLDEYEPSRLFYPDSGFFPVKKGRWIRRLSFFAKDSDYNRLTFLRGVSLNGGLFDSGSYNFTTAAPMSLWDDYENVTSVPLALRIKNEIAPGFTLGGIYTFKGGFNSGEMEAINQVLGFDAEYSLGYNQALFGEFAVSDTTVDEANGMERSFDGIAYSIGVKGPSSKLYFTYMAQDFYPGLSNYRYTRRDQFYTNHIRFTELPGEDKAITIGDGVDRGRLVLGIETSRDFFNEGVNTKVNLRRVQKDNGKYVETAGRVEMTSKMGDQLTLKGLAAYTHLPNTKGGYDPLIYAKTSYAFTDYYSEEDIFMENTAVKDGEDPSIGNAGLGVRYEFSENLAWEGIYEKTNDPGDCPRGLLNNSYVTTETAEGMLLDKMVPFLYSQGFFELPPYDYYDIYKTKLIFKPFTKLTGILSWTRNVNEHAIGIDDNINHIGLEFDYKHNDRLTYGCKYIYSKFIDVYRQINGEGVHYDGHHNIFAEIDYNIDEYQKFSLLFGEFVGYTPLEGLDAPAKFSLSSLDTQHIVRMFYNRRF